MISWVVLAPLAAAGWSTRLLLAARRRVCDGEADAVDVMGDAIFCVAYVAGAVASMANPFIAGGMIASVVAMEVRDFVEKRRLPRSSAQRVESPPHAKDGDTTPKDPPLSP